MSSGEIIPQALCKSYALLIGNYCAGMVRVLCYAVGIISWPISKVLDYVLGDEHTVSMCACIVVQLASCSSSMPVGSLATPTWLSALCISHAHCVD